MPVILSGWRPARKVARRPPRGNPARCRMPHTIDSVTVAGCRIRLFRGGAGQPLVFLHGAGGHTGWMAFLDELSGHFMVLAPEHPGFGASDDPAWLDEVADLAYFHLDL